VKDKLRERLLAIGSAIGYPLFYVFCFVVFASWTFPFEKVRDRIVTSFNESQRSSNSSRELAIADITSSWITGVKMTGVRLIDHGSGKEGSKAEGDKPASEKTSELKIDTLVARVQLLPLLVGNHNVSFHAEAFGGKVSGTWKEQGKDQSLDVSLDGLDLGQVTPLTQFLEVPLEGSLGGTITFDLPEGKVSKSNGSIAIEATDMAVGDGKAKLMGQLAVPRLNVGTFNMDAEIKEGTMKISKLGASGKDVDFLADGRIPLRDQMMDSSVDVNLRFRVSDTYRGKNDATKGLFGAPGTTIPGALDLNPKVKQSKRADGFYTWHARGQLGKPDFSPGGTGGPASGPGGGGAGGSTARPKLGP
jgi:type II secretion system protein N